MANEKFKGLTDTEVIESRKKYGANILTPPEKESVWMQLLEKFKDPIIQILLAAWILSMIVAGIECWGSTHKGMTVFLEPAGIFIAIMLATLTGFFFELHANKEFNLLNKVNDDILVTVFRNGKVIQIPRRDVVVGEIVKLNTGDKIPADGVLLKAVSLEVNESALTGEPLCSKTTDPEEFDEEATYPSNMVMKGTNVADGHGIMRVDKVGDATAYGKVYEGAQIDNSIETPLQAQMRRLAGTISKFGYAAAGITFIVLVAKFFIVTHSFETIDIVSHLLSYFMLAVTLIVVSVPEGLPMSVTLSLALSMKRMLKTNNLVRKMHACETMGATTVICTDKTGTLTQNQMSVAYAEFPALKDNKLSESLESLILTKNISVNSTAELSAADGGVKTIGNPTEAALLLWLRDQNIQYNSIRENAEILSQLTFSTERKYMATVIKSAVSGKNILLVKGAPEILLDICSSVATQNGKTDTAKYTPVINEHLEKYQAKAMRTLGFAYKVLEDDENTAPYSHGKLDVKDLVFLGITAIADPIREDVPEAVNVCREAGINVIIVTGDTMGTAKEIARQIGSWDETCNKDNIITGAEFEELSDDEAAERVKSLKVMCRARPMDKQRLVHLLQQNGQVVAVTGDGTNDAPALKAAQVGLSMGNGTSVAKEASDITIIDNSFANITRAVMWGRSLYRNIQRFLIFQLTINVAACMIVLIGSLIGKGSPLTITQMLYVNLIMDTFAAAAFATLPPRKDVMNNKPRKNSDPIITRSMWQWIGAVATVFVVFLFGLLEYMHVTDGLSAHDITMFFAIFVMMQFWNMFNAKAFLTDKSTFKGLRDCKSFLWIEAIIFIGLVLIVTYGSTMFNVVPLDIKDWMFVILGTSPVILIGEGIRLVKNRLHKHTAA